MQNPIVTIQTTRGTIKVELYPEVAPNTVNNFIYLVKQGFYDGTIFHRVIPGFMIQGGDPEGTGMGGPGYGITPPASSPWPAASGPTPRAASSSSWWTTPPIWTASTRPLAR